jgi:ATP-dependent DNA ligase
MQRRDEEGEAFLQEACERGWEGLIAKKADSAYVHSRSSHWLKFKCVRQQEFVIGGFTEPHGERIGLGALLVGFYRDGDLIYAGKVGTGYDDETLQSLRSRMDRIERKTSPYDVGDVPTKEVHFVTPKLVCEVKFTEWTGDDRLRHPAFMGLRRDKDPEDVHKEAEQQAVGS